MSKSITILHGDNNFLSRESLNTLLDDYKHKGYLIISHEGKALTTSHLESSLLTKDLFAIDAILIENLLGRPKSAMKTQLIEMLATTISEKPIFLWEGKKITPSILKHFQNNNSTVREFKLPNTIFKFLDNFYPNNKKTLLTLLNDTLKTTPDIVLFALLSRRVTDLIQLTSAPETLKLAPWQKSNLLSQSKRWEIKKLQNLISKLILIDWSIKKGLSSLSYSDHLDLLILDL